MQANKEPETPSAQPDTEKFAGGDWLSALLVAVLLIVALSQASLGFRSLAVGLAIFAVAVAAIIAGIAAIRQFSPGDRARVERLRILERVLADNESDPDVKRRALDAVISETQAPSRRRTDRQLRL